MNSSIQLSASPVQLSATAQTLTEATSISLADAILQTAISTPFYPDSIPTTFVQQGEGSEKAAPILLLHGFDSSVFEFRRLLPLLAPHREAWALDLLGFGFTERMAGLTFSPDEIRQHLYAFWEQAIARPLVLVGASMGGAAAIDFALRYPQAVERLVLLDSAGFAKGGPETKVMVPPLDWIATEILRNSWVRNRISQLAYCDRTFSSADAATCAALHLECEGWRRATIAFTKSGGYTFLADRIREVKSKTLVVWGEDDQILGTKDAEKFEQAIADCQLVWIPKCGHVPHLETPQRTADLILPFIR
ncbi:MAG: alpha/beta hydrolase [Cyanobacteria bacterium P01_G01_bin.4]